MYALYFVKQHISFLRYDLYSIDPYATIYSISNVPKTGDYSPVGMPYFLQYAEILESGGQVTVIFSALGYKMAGIFL